MARIVKTLKNAFSYDKRQIRKIKPIVEEINALEARVEELTDKQLAQTADFFRKKLNIDIEKNRKNPDLTIEGQDKEKYLAVVQKERELLLENLPEVFARVREVAKRTANHRHFDVQLIGGIFLAHNKIIEVYTGEGKTNVALLPAALYAISGRGVHIHTVNDYLAKRDAEWAGHLMHRLGFSVAVITSEGAFKFVPDDEAIRLKGEEVKELLKNKDLTNMSTLRGANLVPVTKAEAYLADIVYGEANEFGFDYLRDNMAENIHYRVQRSRYFAIVDEADSILIDEARVPLIISQPDTESTELYRKFASIVRHLDEDEDYVVDEKTKGVTLTEDGVKKVEKLLGVKDIWLNNLYIKHLHSALKAKALFRRDKDYLVKDGKVMIVDEFTGRVQPNRRYSEGLHQAIEAKEGVEVRAESKTLATISHQNFYRLYSFLAGMTGTAATEREEFKKIYGLDVVVVPTYRPIIRKDYPDVVFKTKKAKYKALVEEIKELNKKGQPVLVGTSSIEASEEVSDLLKKEGVLHNVLNAKYHEKEALIISKAGKKGAVTIATNMAGRGTDIKIDDEIRKLGGLAVLGAQRHEARRIDNQLRGRTGRLGDPGYTRFYLSLEDDLLRVFGGDKMKGLFDSLKVDENTPISSKIMSSMIEKAQNKVESLNFDIRRRLVEFDDVINNQRDIVYELRRRILVLLEQEPQDYKKFSKVSKIRKPKDISAELTKKLISALEDYSLMEPYNFGIDVKYIPKHLASPLRFWLARQILWKLQDLLPFTNSIEMDASDYRYIQEYIDAVFPDTLWDKAIRASGETHESFKKKLRTIKSNKKVLVHPEPLYRIVLIALDMHLARFKPEEVRDLIRLVILQTLDYLWMEHIDALDDLRSGISLRGYAQRDPLVEFKQEAAIMFDHFFGLLRDFMTKKIFHVAKKDKVV